MASVDQGSPVFRRPEHLASDEHVPGLCSCPFIDEELLKTRTPLLTGTDPVAKRQEIREYFHRTFSLFEYLHDVFKDDSALFQRPDALRHPLIFYLGHTAVLYINKLRLAKLITERVDEKLESQCAVGVDEMSWDDLTPSHYNWPSSDTVRAYRRKVREVVDKLIVSLPLTLPIGWDSPWWAILLGMEHERIHLETSSVLMRQLDMKYVKGSPFWKVCPEARTDITAVPANELLPVESGAVSLGKPYNHPIWGWDNEYGVHNQKVGSFKASKFLVSHAEWFQFMKAGGYVTKSYWTDEGWRWCSYKRAFHPLFWTPVYPDGSHPPAENKEWGTQTAEELYGGVRGWRYRAFVSEHDLPWDWPVDVNQLEAKAFCNWKAKETGKRIRLPTEEEWSLMRDQAMPEPDGKLVDQPTWGTAPGNINLEHWASSCPVDRFRFPTGFYDVIGNVWQHTETPIMPFKGFRIYKYYDDFSVPTFDGRHNMIKGGSWISTGNEATRLARYAFRRHFFQHAGFRYVESDQDVVFHFESPDCEPEVAKHIEMHYGKPYAGLREPYPVALVNWVDNAITEDEKKSHTTPQPHAVPPLMSPTTKKSTTEVMEANLKNTRLRRALDVGCSVGRVSFELAKSFDLVVGVDLSTRFFRIASELQSTGSYNYNLPAIGEVPSYHSVDLAELKLDVVTERVILLQTDACNLDPKYSEFDLVVASNVLSHLYAPADFLRSVRSRLKRGGYLLLADDWDWNVERTPKEAWLGGTRENAENVPPLDQVERVLAPHLVRVAGPVNLPWVLRHTERTFSYNVSEVALFKLVD